MLYQVKEPEIWVSIPDYPNYKVSTLGRIRGPSGILNFKPQKHGYIHVNLYHNSIPRQFRLSRLLLKTFLPQNDTTLYACHQNGNRTDNRLSNLYWGTPAQNTADMARHGTKQQGEKHYKSKLSDEQVRDIASRPRTYGSGTALAKEFGVTPTQICHIRKGRNRRSALE